MATYRIQRILWATHFAPARRIHGNPSPVYYPSIFLPGTYELPSGNRPGGIPVQKREGNQKRGTFVLNVHKNIPNIVEDLQLSFSYFKSAYVHLRVPPRYARECTLRIFKVWLDSDPTNILLHDHVVPGDGDEMLHQFEIDSVSLRITLHYNSIEIPFVHNVHSDSRNT